MSDADGVRGVLTAFVEALNNGDGETAARLHSDADDAITIGSDPEEWFEGGAAIRAAFSQGGEGGIKGRIEEPKVGAQGDVGWYAARGAFITPDGTEHPIRVTGVARREGGEWKLFQTHTSFAVRNDEVFGS